MAAFNSQWSFEGLAQPSVTEIFDQMATHLAELERKIDALGHQPIQSDHYQPQPNYTPACYHPYWQDHPTYSWNNDQDQFYTPCISYSLPQPQEHNSTLEFLTDIIERNEMKMNNPDVYDPIISYSSEFSYPQLPPLQQENSELEDILTKALERMEESIQRQETAIQNQEIYREQLASVITNCLQDTTELNPKDDGEEQCEADTLENGKVFPTAVRRNLKRSRPDMKEEYEFNNKRSRIEEKEKKDEDDHALDSEGIKQNSPMSGSQQCNSPEYVRVDLGESNIKIMDEFKFGGKLQSHAEHIKEKTSRRHEKTIFAIEPD